MDTTATKVLSSELGGELDPDSYEVWKGHGGFSFRAASSFQYAGQQYRPGNLIFFYN